MQYTKYSPYLAVQYKFLQTIRVLKKCLKLPGHRTVSCSCSGERLATRARFGGVGNRIKTAKSRRAKQLAVLSV